MTKKIDYYKWNQHRVTKKGDLPITSHMQVLVFTTRSEYSPAYDKHDSDTYTEVPDIQLYAFTEAQLLGDFIIDATKAEVQYAFFEVKKLGTAKINVTVDVK